MRNRSCAIAASGLVCPLFVDDGVGWLSMPVGSLEEVDEVDSERLIGLTYLPILGRAVALQFFAEPAHLIDEWLVRGWA